MPELGKSTLAQTFKFDCDRFLRLQLATKAERDGLGVEADQFKRPGIELIQKAGRRWEIDKYQDLLNVAGATNIEHRIDPNLDPLIERRPFLPIENIFDILRRPSPPLGVIEAKFRVPLTITPNFRDLHDRYGIDTINAIPDILWLRRYPTGAPLIPTGDPTVGTPEYEIHIIDVKMADEPALRHFTEVTFYGLALAAALVEQGLAGRYAVSAEGFIWPGSHDANEFRNLFRDFQSKGDPDALTAALLKTLEPVPYEVYQVHVRQFFEDRLPRVLGQAPLDAAWHVAPKCQLCQYLGFCSKRAEETDHLSRIAWLNEGQAELLRSRGISTTRQLATAIQTNSPEWQATVAASHQLRAEAPALLARAKSLQSGQPEIVEGRKCATMPAWSGMSIFITAHFDPGSGITFALGASRVYFPPGRNPGDRPVTDEQVFIVDRVDNLNPDTERARLIEFTRLVTGWLDEAHRANEQIMLERRARGERDNEMGKVQVHVFFWDTLEIRQIRRMFERHMAHPDVIELVELLVRLFPPEHVLPDPDYYKAQPGTAVKDVLRLLVGLPLPHAYTLIEAANAFYPNTKQDGELYQFRIPYGFETLLSDQIPFERAYELWEDRIYLKQYSGRKYARGEIWAGIEGAVKTRMKAVQHIVAKLRQHHRDLLVLRKPPFSANRATQMQIPERARQLIAFEKLNVVCEDIENRQSRSLPVAEREARFISIRGLIPASGPTYDASIARVRANRPQYASRTLLAFTFARGSRDTRIKEDEFLLGLTNEDSEFDLDMTWRKCLDLTFDEAEGRCEANGLKKSVARYRLRSLLQVTVVRLEATQDPPFLIVTPNDNQLFQFAQNQGLLDLHRPMVIDPLYQDFSSERIEAVLRLIGGNPPPMRRRR